MVFETKLKATRSFGSWRDSQDWIMVLPCNHGVVIVKNTSWDVYHYLRYLYNKYGDFELYVTSCKNGEVVETWCGQYIEDSGVSTSWDEHFQRMLRREYCCVSVGFMKDDEDYYV